MSQLSGASILRKEDAALLSGRGRYADDLPTPAGTLHAHVIRSPHAHADIICIDASAALAQAGVWAVITGDDVKALSDPFLIALKAPVHQWSLAVERVRYVGEPVALIVAESRYRAEDAAELVRIEYAERPAAVDPLKARESSAPVLHPEAKSNEISVRQFGYGDTKAAFAQADARVRLVTDYPRLSFTPMECYVVVAQYKPTDGSYDVLANFQGPFSTHPVMARALRVPGTKFRVRIPPDSGGSFGIKLSVFPYMVLAAIAARITGRPVKWVEDRVEHLVAASTGPNRITEIEAAVTRDGRILGLKLDQLEDYGAYLRAPMPGPLYRMHGSVTGAYDIPNVDVTNRVVLTNKMPAGLIRGFGGPQLYLAIERLVQRIACELSLDPLEVIRRNLIPTEKFPYRTAAGALYDSGDYVRAVDTTVGDGRLDDLKARREAARAAGRHYGIGFAAVVEPGMSNMGYLSTLLTASARERAGPKNGAVSMATVNVDPLGAVSVTADVTVQGQGHETVLSQIVAEQLGLKPDDITVTLEIDTAKDPWSIAAGTYSCRFTPGTAVAAQMAAKQVRDKLAGIAAKQLNTLPDDIEFADGAVRSRRNPDNAMPFSRAAGTAHWSPVMLPEGMAPSLSETGVWSPQELEPPSSDDRINTSLTYGFVFDMCGVEIDPSTYQVRVDRYVSMHDAGSILNPLIANGQIHGAFAQGIASALYEEFVSDENGNFMVGTFADYLVPTVSEIPKLELLHQETPSPLTPLGAKGLAEGNCMSVPACVANAVADALGVKDISLPITPRRIHALLEGAETPPPPTVARAPEPAPAKDGRNLTGQGSFEIAAPPAAVWRALLDPERLKATIPGCHELQQTGAHDYRALVSLGVGPVRGKFEATVGLSQLVEEKSGRIGGGLTGPLGEASGSGTLRLAPTAAGTRLDYDYAVTVGGKVAAVGGRMLDGAAAIIIRQFFERLSRGLNPQAMPSAETGLRAWLAALRTKLGGRR
ncbi:MAG: molybdopterin-dependent oxidoreductase [Xanthobacteraceae bacterium]|nr:molybdopterin-dependent oxidoreductase [Xanthobacteraceae bacterium]